eukprot:2357728-Prymnesium_polylepis.4
MMHEILELSNPPPPLRLVRNISQAFAHDDVVHVYRKPPLYVAKSRDTNVIGNGLFTYVDLHRGQQICFFTGKVFENEETWAQSYAKYGNDADALRSVAQTYIFKTNYMRALNYIIDPGHVVTKHGHAVYENSFDNPSGFINEPSEGEGSVANCIWFDREVPLRRHSEHVMTRQEFERKFTIISKTKCRMNSGFEDELFFNDAVEYNYEYFDANKYVRIRIIPKRMKHLADCEHEIAGNVIGLPIIFAAIDIAHNTELTVLYA